MSGKPKQLSIEDIERIAERATEADRLAYMLWIAGERLSCINNQLHHFLKPEKSGFPILDKERRKVRSKYRLLAKIALFWPQEPTCIKCGCTQLNACEGGCSWIFIGGQRENYGLCSACFSQIGLDVLESRRGRGGKRR
jgi:hypothetical protein